jgi:hypothetical protein
MIKPTAAILEYGDFRISPHPSPYTIEEGDETYHHKGHGKRHDPGDPRHPEIPVLKQLNYLMEHVYLLAFKKHPAFQNTI